MLPDLSIYTLLAIIMAFFYPLVIISPYVACTTNDIQNEILDQKFFACFRHNCLYVNLNTSEH